MGSAVTPQASHLLDAATALVKAYPAAANQTSLALLISTYQVGKTMKMSDAEIGAQLLDSMRVVAKNYGLLRE